MKETIYTKKVLISLFKDLEERIGERPTLEHWKQDAKTPSVMPVRCRFGNWTEFVKEMGLEPLESKITPQCRKATIAAHKGKRSCNWKGGKRKDKFGYIQVWNPDHPNTKQAGYIHEHRLVMSNHLNRPLRKNENVHHKNGKRDDNRLENLELWTTSQPSGSRVKDKIEWAKQFLADYGYIVSENPELLEQEKIE